LTAEPGGRCLKEKDQEGEGEQTMTDLIVRDARPSDRDAIRQVTLSAYQEYAAGMPAHWERYRQNILATLADVRPAEQIVAEQDRLILGNVLLYPTGTALTAPDGVSVRTQLPEVRLLAVVPAARGRGVGAALMKECIRRAGAAGASAVTLHTTDMMQAALRLYQRMGFVRAPALDFHPVPELTILGYRLDLETRGEA
jgi:GNAT superfamily N-acetyltransferase